MTAPLQLIEDELTRSESVEGNLRARLRALSDEMNRLKETLSEKQDETLALREARTKLAEPTRGTPSPSL